MKKLMNAPVDYVDEALDGLTAAYPSLVRAGTAGRVIRRAGGMRKDKVGIVSGGGSGHLPLFTGYVGTGLLDACAIGDVFAGPGDRTPASTPSRWPTAAAACCGSTAITAATA